MADVELHLLGVVSSIIERPAFVDAKGVSLGTGLGGVFGRIASSMALVDGISLVLLGAFCCQGDMLLWDKEGLKQWYATSLSNCLCKIGSRSPCVAVAGLWLWLQLIIPRESTIRILPLLNHAFNIFLLYFIRDLRSMVLHVFDRPSTIHSARHF
jgi:hypothetical protein